MRTATRERMIRIMAGAGLAAIMLFSWLGQADAGAAVRSNESFRQVNVRSNLMASPRAGANLNFESEEHTCQGFVSRDLVFR